MYTGVLEFLCLLFILVLIVIILFLKHRNAVLREDNRYLENFHAENEALINKHKKYLDTYKGVLFTLEKLAAEESKCKCQVKVSGIINESGGFNANRDYLLYLEAFVVLRKDESYASNGMYTFSLILLDLRHNIEVCTLKADVVSKFQASEQRLVRTARLLALDTPIEYERQGYATFLLKHFVLSCRNNGCDEITGDLQMNTRIGVDNLKRFYEGLGFAIGTATIRLSELWRWSRADDT